VRRGVAVGLLGAALAGCSGNGAEPRADTQPGTRVQTQPGALDAVSFSLSGGLGASSSVSLAPSRGVVLYRYATRPGDRADTAEIRPSEVQWKRFWSAVERLGVWDWRSRYGRRPPPPDAVSWELELAHEGRSMRSSGYGEGPPTLTDLIGALSALVGGRDL
jgi:hypothetical protein